MANLEHLEILKQGAKVWNEWRREHPEIMPNLSHTDLSHADLGRADLSHADLSFADFSHADLNGAILGDAQAKGANLTRADLSYAQFNRADLRHVQFSGTNFSNTVLLDVTLNSSIVNYADFTASMMGGTTLADIDLSAARGLEAIWHFYPSYIGIDTLYKSAGRIPKVFLRGCGVPESFIVQIPALITALEPIQFYKCFISFTEADDAFSERLYNDLQAKGVRCWRWKEDAEWGKTLMRSIDEAVRLYDKLIIICSEQSLNSPAVIREIERALQKEDDLARQGKESEVLFPIRLDDYIFTGWQHYRKADVLAKNIGDFRQWKNHDSYSKAFARLLRDLKAKDGQTAEG